MNVRPLRGRKGPEAKIQTAIIRMLRGYEWFVMVTHGNMFQSGFPDLYATHKRYGGRWIEVKRPKMEGSRFTKAQLDTFPKLEAYGTPVYVLTGDTKDEYEKLFVRDRDSNLKGNWTLYLSIMKF